jgi:hypothetical protein
LTNAQLGEVIALAMAEGRFLQSRIYRHCSQFALATPIG